MSNGMVEPSPCPTCSGKGVIWVYRMDDRRYPKKCHKCEGSGIARAALGDTQ